MWIREFFSTVIIEVCLPTIRDSYILPISIANSIAVLTDAKISILVCSPLMSSKGINLLVNSACMRRFRHSSNDSEERLVLTLSIRLDFEKRTIEPDLTMLLFRAILAHAILAYVRERINRVQIQQALLESALREQ